MARKEDIVNFLTTDANINRLNFAFRTYRVYPTAYQKDVANALRLDSIKIREEGGSSKSAKASYYMDFDLLSVSPTFNIHNWRDQAFLVHECTHAHLDIQNLGKHPGHENEAVAYLAEAVFLEAAGNNPLGTETIRIVAH